MAGWENTIGHVFPYVRTEEPQDGVAGNALNSKWVMSWGTDENGDPIFTTTPASIDYANATSIESNEAIGAPNLFPHVKYVDFPAPSTATKMRFSGNVFNVASDAHTHFLVEDAKITSIFASLDIGSIDFSRIDGTITFTWEGVAVSVVYAGWISPGGNQFRAAMEFSGTTATGYYYPIPNLGDGLTNEMRNNSSLIKIGSVPWTRRMSPSLYPGCLLGFNPGFFAGVWIEYDPAPGGSGGPPQDVAPFPSNDYGLYKSQLTLHGLLNNAKTSS